jgi:hypothetical protein
MSISNTRRALTTLLAAASIGVAACNEQDRPPALAVTSAQAPAMPASVVQTPACIRQPPPIGEYEYSLRNAISDGPVVERREANDPLRRVRRNGGSIWEDECGRQIRRSGSSPAEEIRYISSSAQTNHSGQLPDSPMAVGVNWTHRYFLVNGLGGRHEAVRSCSVDSRAPHTTPAGTFDAWKVVCHIDRLDGRVGRVTETFHYRVGDLIILSGAQEGSLTGRMLLVRLPQG